MAGTRAGTAREEQPHQELGAQFYLLGQRFIAGETPILAGHGLTMWDYVVLLALDDRAVTTQLQLAGLTRRDKTRLIANLDGLESAGLVSRARDRSDRRAMNVQITSAGRATVLACRSEIRQMELTLLAGLPADDQVALRGMLTRLVSTLSVSAAGPRSARRQA